MVETFNRIDDWVCDHSPEELISMLRSQVYGQEESLVKIGYLLYAFLKNAGRGVFQYKYHFLIAGPSGCGKSTFAAALQKVLPVPVLTLDASALTPPGWKGASIGDILLPLLQNRVKDSEGVFVCVLDELDKSVQPMDYPQNYHRYVQESLLKMLDGGEITDEKGNCMDCSRALFIGMGAFCDVKETACRPDAQGIGFDTRIQPKKKEAKLDRETLVNSLGSEQFLGRFVDCFEFSPPGLHAYMRMTFHAAMELVKVYGKEADPPPELRKEVAERAMQSRYGGRFIRQELWHWYLGTKLKQKKAAEETLTELLNCS